jgi:lysyl-tRNA synthetase class 1
MTWLQKIVDEVLASRGSQDEIVVSSGVSPSGFYHLGTLREIMTAEAVHRELELRGIKSRHIHVVDDLDVFRKVPAMIDESFREHLGKPLCEVPSPDPASSDSYADYFLKDLYDVSEKLHLQMEIVRAHELYRDGFFTDAIEKTLGAVESIKTVLEHVSGHAIDSTWTPVQFLEQGRLKNRPFQAIDTDKHIVTYLDGDGVQQTARYDIGEVKLNWRIDWPARWWKLDVAVEPFGRDHATKGGSYDTGVAISQDVFNYQPPFPIPYNFINRTGQSKKMSKSAGDTITATGLLEMLPPELIWYFMLRSTPEKQLFFDEEQALMQLFDDFAELRIQATQDDDKKHLLDLCLLGVKELTVSQIPFTHLVANYQAALKNVAQTLDLIQKTEYQQVAQQEAEIIERELAFIDAWLESSAPDSVVFSLLDSVERSDFSDLEITFFRELAQHIENAPKEADGDWFHRQLYELKSELKLEPKDMFRALYRLLIGKESGPRAGWFLATLPRDWLLKRLDFQG